MSSPLSAFAGDAIYLDTMLPYALLRGIDPAVKPFFARLESGEFLAYTSALTFDELAYRLLLALIKDSYGGSPLDRLRDEEEKLIGEFGSAVIIQLRQLQEFPNLQIVDVIASDLETMNESIAQYHVRPRDALHFAAMKRVGCLNLASNDQHFDRIPLIERFAL
mgnify:CR=1 FL=1